MMIARHAVLLGGLATATSGCAAAVVPVIASGLVARKQGGPHGDMVSHAVAPAQDTDAPQSRKKAPPAAAAPVAIPPVPADTTTMVPGRLYRGEIPRPGDVPAPVQASVARSSVPTVAVPLPPVDDGVAGATPIVPPPAAAPGASPPAGMQYLYGSAEAAATAVQAWHALVSYAAGKVLARPADSVVLAPAAALARPAFLPCGSKPLAVVLDIDETVLLNLGFEADDALHPGRRYDERRWQDWERTGAGAVTAAPGAGSAITALRTMGVAVIFNSNRSAANAAGTERALVGVGMGPASHGDTLFLQGDDSTGALKDGRRWLIATRFCVIAMAGDQLGDFTDLFNDAGLAARARRRATLVPEVARMFGSGWFILPNPVYGTALKGDMDEVFPRDKRWAPAGAP